MKSNQIDLLVLLALSCVSLFFITGTDRAIAQLLAIISNDLLWIAHIRIPSFLLSLGILFYIGRESLELCFSRIGLKRVIVASALWLVPAAYGIFVLKVWVPSIKGVIDITAFMVTGLCAEEFLFRGSLYSLADRVFNSRAIGRIPVAVFYSAAFFGMQHIQYHDFSVTDAAIAQIGHTAVMGIFFGLIRHHSGTVWVPIFVHMS